MREGLPCLKILTIVVGILRQAHHCYWKKESKWGVKSYSLSISFEEERDKWQIDCAICIFERRRHIVLERVSFMSSI